MQQNRASYQRVLQWKKWLRSETSTTSLQPSIKKQLMSRLQKMLL